MALISHRFSVDYVPQLGSQALVKELKGFVELYSAYQLDYDYFDYKHSPTFSLFIENFEMKA